MKTDMIQLVLELEWDRDGRILHMDDTMQMSNAYDWDGYECFRQEGYGSCGSYIIWPDHIGSNSWNVYGTRDGLYIQDVAKEEAARAAADADHAARVIAALDGELLAELVGALRQLARLGNGDKIGNSDGNMIARALLAKLGMQP